MRKQMVSAMRNNSIACALAGLFFIWVLAPSHSLAAECLEWDLGQVPEWHLKQGSDGIVSFTFQQHGDQLTGTGNYYFTPNYKDRTYGNLNGTIHGDTFEFTVTWGGVYSGTVNSDGTLHGQTHNTARTERANWNARFEKATCAKYQEPPGGGTPAGGGSQTPQNQGGEWAAFASDGNGNWGYAVGKTAEQQAKDLALNGCGGAGKGCKVFWTTNDKCVSYAESRTGGYWYAADGGSSQDQARQKALQVCQSGSAPPNSCKTTVAWCR